MKVWSGLGLVGAAVLWVAAGAAPAKAEDAAVSRRLPHGTATGQGGKIRRPPQAATVSPVTKTIPMDFSGMSRSVQDVDTPSHAHGNVGFPGEGGARLSPGLVPSTTYRF